MLQKDSYVRLGEGLIKKGFLEEVMLSFEKYGDDNQMGK